MQQKRPTATRPKTTKERQSDQSRGGEGGATNRNRTWQGPRTIKTESHRWTNTPVTETLGKRPRLGKQKPPGSMKSRGVPRRRGGWRPPPSKGLDAHKETRRGKFFSPKCVLYVRLYVPFPWSCLRSLGFVLLCYLAVMLSYVCTDVLSQVCLQMCALISVQSRQVCAMSLACERMARGGSQPSAAHVVLVVGMVLFYRCMWYRIHFALCT